MSPPESLDIITTYKIRGLALQTKDLGVKTLDILNELNEILNRRLNKMRHTQKQL